MVSHGGVCDYDAKSLERSDGKSQLIDGINCLLTLVAFVKEELQVVTILRKRSGDS